jgi:hypothetical protein
MMLLQWALHIAVCNAGWLIGWSIVGESPPFWMSMLAGAVMHIQWLSANDA